MVTRFCRDCANFEERRDVDDTVLCRKNAGPYMCCENFEPKDKNINTRRLYHKSCAECINFEEINGLPICAKSRGPGVACQGFKSRFERLKATRHNNHVKTVLVTHIAKDVFELEHLSAFMMDVGRRAKS